METVTLWRPTGPEELRLVEESGWKRWPRRLPNQPIFYPVLNQDYATRIARDWNVKASGAGYVTRFRVAKAFLDRYEVHQVGGAARGVQVGSLVGARLGAELGALVGSRSQGWSQLLAGVPLHATVPVPDMVPDSHSAEIVTCGASSCHSLAPGLSQPLGRKPRT